MDYKDYYKILGVPKTATQADIKKAFRKLARQNHPDLKPGDKAAEQRFKDVNEANEVLSDAAKRKQYDELGANWEAYARAGAAGGAGGPFAGYGGQSGQGGNVRYEFRTAGGGGQDFSDFFRMFFSGAQAGAAASSGRRGSGGGRGTAQAESGPSIEDLLAGLGGTGTGAGPTGSGTAEAARRMPPAEAEAEISLGEAFQGTTRLVDVDGRRLEVKLPRGVDTGSRVRLTGKGGNGRDLNIIVKVTPDATFSRNGADLTREVRVTLREALLGAEIPVRTLKGRVLLTIPAGTQNGRQFRLTGQGMPRLKGDGSGDLYVKIATVLPTNLTDEAKEAGQRFLDLVNQPDPRSQ